MFQSARWKAYLQSLQDDAAGDGGNGHQKCIYHIFHSQKLWFVRDEDNGHHKAAMEHLKQCDELLEDCNNMVDELEETLANTPKPSEALDWSSL